TLAPAHSAKNTSKAVAGGFAHLSNTFPGEQSGALWGQTPRHHSHCKEPSGADMTARKSQYWSVPLPLQVHQSVLPATYGAPSVDQSSGVISGSVAPRVCLQKRAQCPAKASGLTQLGWVILTVRNDINGPLQPLSAVVDLWTENMKR
ncbi:hypothetical protein QQF64_017929, partial [Cirrhinus molitorella]